MVSHHPAKFGGCGQFGSGDMFSVVEKQDCICCRTICPKTTMRRKKTKKKKKVDDDLNICMLNLHPKGNTLPI